MGIFRREKKKYFYVGGDLELHEVRRVYPDVVFLSEAFTRPKLQYSLAKAGFTAP